MTRKVFFILMILVLPVSVFAGTLLEQSLKGYDPYLADMDGFDSLFVNPAGISGQTRVFSLAVEGGTWGKLENYKLLKDNLGAMNSMVNGGFTTEQAVELLPLLVQDIDQTTLNGILNGTSIDGVPLATVQDPNYNWATQLAGGDPAVIASNMSDPALQEALMNQFDSVRYSMELEARLGTLIRGFGFGLYNNTYALYSLGAQGIEDMLTETGAVAGYGFDLGPFKLGVSGKFALLLADNPMYPFNIEEPISDQQVQYGYAWGVDAGAIWEPVDSLRFAVVFNDVIGSVTKDEDMATGTVGEFIDGNISGPSGGYSWTFDISAGMSWQPDWQGIRPQFSLDFYDIIGLARESNDESYSGLEDFYQSGGPLFLRHMRVGANVRFLGFLDVGASYYMEYITLGAGIDISFFEFFVEAKAKHNFEDVGANAMLKVKF